MSGLFKSPKAPPVTPLPDPDDVALKARKRREAATLRTRSGRQSTILSDSETLG